MMVYIYRGVMAFAVLLFAYFASGCIGDQLPTEPEDKRWFTKAVVNSVDGNRSFSDNFHSLLAILCPSSVYCPKNGTINETNSVSMTASEHPAKVSLDFSPRFISDDLASVINKAEQFYSCCIPCDCDHHCIERGTCCPAAANTFLPPGDRSLVKQECVYAGVDSYLPNALVSKTVAAGFSYFMVTDCFSADLDEDIAARCRHPELDDIGPVYSPATERIYKNKFCAMCNGDARVISWRPVVTFNSEFSFTGILKIPSTLNDLYTFLYRSGINRMLNLLYMPPDNLNTEKHACFLSNGMEKEKNDCEGGFEFDRSGFLDRACAFGGLGYESSRKSFANVFCFICHSAAIPRKNECFNWFKSGAPPISLSAILVGSRPDDVTDDRSEVKDAPCDCKEYYDHNKNLCRGLICPPGELFDHCTCAKFLQNIQGMKLKIYLEVKPELPSRMKFEKFTTKLNNNGVRSFKAELVNTIRTRWGPLDETKSLLFRETSISDQDHLKFHIVVGTSVQGNTDDVELIRDMFTTFQSTVSQRILGSVMTINIGPLFRVSLSNSSISALGLAKTINSSDTVIKPFEPNAFDKDKNSHPFYIVSQTVSKLVYCQRVVLVDAEVALLKTRPRDVGVSPAYLPYVFMEEDGSMCLEDFEEAFLVSSGSNPWFGVYRGIWLCLLIAWAI